MVRLMYDPYTDKFYSFDKETLMLPSFDNLEDKKEEMNVHNCNLAGTSACQYCSNNPNVEQFNINAYILRNALKEIEELKKHISDLERRINR